MMKTGILLCVLVLFGSVVFGAVSTINNGDGTTTLRAQYSVPTAKVADVRDDICRGLGWTAQVTCSQAMISLGQCSAGQFGTLVSNPETCIQAIDRTVRAFMVGLRKAGEIREVEDASVKPVKDLDSSADIQ